jgi:hypothetical protein
MPILIKLEMMLLIDLINLLLILKTQIMNSSAIALLIYNKQDPQEETLVLPPEALPSTGGVITLSKRDMLEERPMMVGPHQATKIGLTTEHTT